MRLWVRLATFFLSLVLTAGVLMHEVASAQMSIDMAATPAVERQDEVCPACPQDTDEQVVCDLDCTVPLLFTATSTAAVPQIVAATGLVWPADATVRTRQPGFDPAPPRATILS
ncbi:hypothetical protein GE300_14495 [Rhodobacteraceae bacterium 2CG4]|uniref:Uncharacterized protein n=1 Tax=Halovulum marinum TaxID=2662447 RepID=A0A6L5Z3Z2_9RHOB|nr:hypothetical protein [Halovulum marinum]MSU90810.1 hypothetical protein [Halovulum marinum]